MAKKKKRRSKKRKIKVTMPLLTRRLAVIGGLLLIVVAGTLIYAKGKGTDSQRHIELDYKKYPVRGIDVSQYNGVVDFNKVKKAGYEFVFIRSTSGSDKNDTQFDTNYKNATAAKLKVGAYHYFRFAHEGDKQAQKMLAALKGKKLDLPVVIDVENEKNDKNISVETIKKRLKAMVTALEKKGYKVMIYTNKKEYQTFISGTFDNLPLWIASFDTPEATRNAIKAKHTIQQHSHVAVIDGIKEKVDLNIFIGSKAEWDKWLKKYK